MGAWGLNKQPLEKGIGRSRAKKRLLEKNAKKVNNVSKIQRENGTAEKENLTQPEN